jgi:hypothetical protein
MQALQAAAPKTAQAERSHSTHRSHSRRSPLSRYEDRVCLAHVAMMTFGLVALLGAWHDPVQGWCFVASACALMIFGALLILDSRIVARLSFTSRAVVVARAREATFFDTTRHWLHWYCCANRLGVPPTSQLVLCHTGNAEPRPNWFTVASFCFPVRETYSVSVVEKVPGTLYLSLGGANVYFSY